MYSFLAPPRALGECYESLVHVVSIYLTFPIPCSLKANTTLNFSHMRLWALWKKETPAYGPQEIKSAWWDKIPHTAPCKSAHHNILCSFSHAGGADNRRVFLPRVAVIHGKKKNPPAALYSRVLGFSFPSYSPWMTLAPFLIPFPSLHTLMLLTNPQWTWRLIWFHM